jgi:hypothetical protein
MKNLLGSLNSKNINQKAKKDDDLNASIILILYSADH